MSDLMSQQLKKRLVVAVVASASVGLPTAPAQERGNGSGVNRAGVATAGPPAGQAMFAAPIEPSASLLRRGVRAGAEAPVTLDQTSFTYIPTPPPKEIRKYDIVTIRVDQTARMSSDGQTQRRKSSQYNAILQELVLFATGAGESGEEQQSPQVTTQLQHTERGQLDLETEEMMQFNIAATVADIYPNGNIVLEAHRTLTNNEEKWDYSLTGICRREDINPNTNMVLSRDIADLAIEKRERGAVRDGYRRGWFTKFFDTVNPF